MIVLDTTVLVYAAGAEQPLRKPAQALVRAVGDGLLGATTTPEVIQELVHVRARRRDRRDAARLGASYATLLRPLLVVGEAELELGLRLVERVPGLGAFDCVLAAAALERGAEALVSADRALDAVRGLRFVALGSPECAELLAAAAD